MYHADFILQAVARRARGDERIARCNATTRSGAREPMGYQI